MKYFLSFLGGVTFALYFCPPTPSVEIDKMTRKQIALEVIEYLEENEFDTLAAKRSIVTQKRGWF